MGDNVILVNPPYPEGVHQHSPFIPLGIAYLGAVLEEKKHPVKVIDCQALKINFDVFERRLERYKPKFIGITSSTLTYKSALRIAEISKKIHPECVTILGGCHATFWDAQALKECAQLDFVVRKEGEYTLLEIVDTISKNEHIKGVQGITYRKNGQIIQNVDRPYIENLDKLPFPAHHLLPLKHLIKQSKIIFPLTTSRGCVYWCNFCTAVRMFGRKFRMRSPTNVVDEIQHLHEKYGASQFTFYDDAFTVNQLRAKKICEEIKKRHLEIEWDCGTRVDMVSKALLEEMKEAGCIAVWFGVESGSQTVLDKMEKRLNIIQTQRAFKWAHETGLMTVASVILGFPGETKNTAMKTIDLISELNPTDIGYYIATPYPGTPLYELVKENGWLKTSNFNKYDTATPVFETPTLSMKDLKNMREIAYQKFYLRPSYVFRMIRKGGIYGFSATKTSLAHLLRALKLRLA